MSASFYTALADCHPLAWREVHSLPASGDRAHPHAPGVVGAAATSRAGAARGTISGGL